MHCLLNFDNLIYFIKLHKFILLYTFLVFWLGQRFNGHGHHEVSAMMNPFGFGGFGGGFGSGFDGMFSMANAGFPSNGVNGGSSVKRTSISTRFANGKKITTKKYVL